MKFWLQFKFWANFAKQQTEWIWLATVFGQGGALPPGQSRGVQRRHAPGHAAELAPRYIGPFPIIDQCGQVAYRLKLPERLSGIHNVFHVSQLKKCLRVQDQVQDIEDVELEPDLTYSEYPIRVLDQRDRITRRTTTKWYKIQWSQHFVEEATWESEDYLMENFLEFHASLQYNI